MKNIYLLILATAFFSRVSAQSAPPSSKVELDPASYVDVNFDGNYNSLDGDFLLTDDVIVQTGGNGRILFGYNILWVFNDVGNHNSNRVTTTGVELKKAGGVSNKKIITRD